MNNTRPPPQSAPDSALPAAAATPRRGSLLRTVRAVAWSLIGLRKGSEYRQDVEQINPLHIIAVGLLAVFLLVAGLIALVHAVV